MATTKTTNCAIVIALLLLSAASSAQIPDGYYNTAEGKWGSELKTALHNIIKGHTDNDYKGLWTTYQTSDTIQIAGNTYIYDIYSIRADRSANYFYTVSADQCGDSYKSEGDCYNREHIVPQSWFNEARPMVSDAHHIPPTDGKVNGMRANYPHAQVATATWTSTNGSRLGTCATAGYTGTVFEPIDEFKGDIARMYLYMATRYEDKIASWSGEVIDGTTFPAYKPWYIDMLLQWHKQDSVSNKERWRNEAIYARQGNRNPFIDRPEFALYIWDPNCKPPTTPPTTPTTAATTIAHSISIYPNPTKTGFYIETDATEVLVFNPNGTPLLRCAIAPNSRNWIDIARLPQGLYIIRAGNATAKIVKI